MMPRNYQANEEIIQDVERRMFKLSIGNSTTNDYKNKIEDLCRKINRSKKKISTFESHLSKNSAPAFLDYRYFVRPCYEFSKSNVNEHNKLIEKFQRGYLLNSIKSHNELIKKFECELEELKKEFICSEENAEEIISLIQEKFDYYYQNSNDLANEVSLKPYEVKYGENLDGTSQLNGICLSSRLIYTKLCCDCGTGYKNNCKISLKGRRCTETNNGKTRSEMNKTSKKNTIQKKNRGRGK